MISGIIFIIKAQYQCQYIFLKIFSHITTLSSSEKVCYSLLLPGNYMNDLKINQEYWDINHDFWRFPGNILEFFLWNPVSDSDGWTRTRTVSFTDEIQLWFIPRCKGERHIYPTVYCFNGCNNYQQSYCRTNFSFRALFLIQEAFGVKLEVIENLA